MRNSRKIAWIVAGVSLAIAALSIIAVMALTPLKTTEPYVIMVDKTTGYSQAVRKLVRDELNPLTEDEAVVLGEVAAYVVARETIDPADVDKRTNLIRLTTQAEEYRRYAGIYTRMINEAAPGMRRTVAIKSITPNLANKSVSVRFSTTTRNQNQLDVEDWISTISYDFQDLEIPLELRYLNPLGFIVESYRVDEESL